ncbi:MAG: orotidine-5'-phosphate decarboxylase [Candidatus Nanopelagicales bacterium]
MKLPIALALDAPNLNTAKSWSSQASPYVSTLKIGLETYLRDGKSAIIEIRKVSDCDIFLDLKLHDIPATVAGACHSVKDLNPKFLTVHASGGFEMISEAVKALPNTLITAVTILTSLNDEGLKNVGFNLTPGESAIKLAKLAVAAGARAIVCSALEVSKIREAVGKDVVLITPGIRPAGSVSDDQKRVATPSQALKDGANLLVIGRPITSSDSIQNACEQLRQEINSIK